MVEILSPVGNISALKSAVANRADAVYLGLEQFNCRLKADNFSTHNITEWVDFCHLYGTKVYVTINTLIKQKELDDVDKLLIACEKAKVDAVIIADLAVAAKAQKLCPSVALHASTQMGVHNYLGAKFLEELGFSRVVLSRECKLEDIKEIKANTNLEIEYFVHGAMCVCFSGSCLLSSIATGNSGNRGLCLQPCRKEYSESLTGKKGYLISPKDQCLIDHVKQLVECGVDSLKIEGRLKSAEYVGLVTEKYKKVAGGLQLEKEDFSQMKRVFNRGGFSEGYAFSDKNQILYTKTQNHIGEQIGEVVSSIKTKDYFKIEIKSNFEIQNGDGLKIFRNGDEVGGFEVSIIEKNNDRYKLYSKKSFDRGDKVHITFDSNLKRKYEINEMPKILLDTKIELAKNEVKIRAKYKNKIIDYNTNCKFDLAQNCATSAEEVEKQFAKTGGTPFEFTHIEVKIFDNLFVPKSVINNVRREYLAWLERQTIDINAEIFSQNKKTFCKKAVEDFLKNHEVLSDKSSHIVICDKVDFDTKNDNTLIKIVLNYNNFDKSVLNYAKNHNNLYIKLPKIAMTADLKIITNLLDDVPKSVGIYADSLYAYYLAVTQNRKVIGGLGLNLCNSLAASILGLKSFVASPELCKSEVEDLNKSCGIFTLGYLPVMNFCHCPIRHFTNCSCADCKYKEYSLQDKYGEYKVRRIKIANCYFEMLNSSCHFIELKSLPKDCFACIDATELENCEQIVSKYLNNSCNIFNNSIKLTKGQFLRGVN